jgi:hypothetical protein
MCNGGGLFFLKGAKLRILHYKQYLDRRCGIQKNYWVNDDHIKQEDGIMCALFIVYIYCSFLSKEHIQGLSKRFE